MDKKYISCINTTPDKGTTIYIANPFDYRGYEAINFYPENPLCVYLIKHGFAFSNAEDALIITLDMKKALTNVVDCIKIQPEHLSTVHVPVVFERKNSECVKFDHESKKWMWYFKNGFVFATRKQAITASIAMKYIPTHNLKMQKEANIINVG